MVPSTRSAARAGACDTSVSIQESAGDRPYRGRGSLPKRAEVESALGRVDGVKKLSELPTDERAHAFELVGEADHDLRPEVFQLMVEKGWVLLELHRDSQTLEDVFRSLTIGDERRNRHIGADADDEEEDEDEEDDVDDAESSPSKGGDEKAVKAVRS